MQKPEHTIQEKAGERFCIFCGATGEALNSSICVSAKKIQDDSRREAAGRVQPAPRT